MRWSVINKNEVCKYFALSIVNLHRYDLVMTEKNHIFVVDLQNVCQKREIRHY